VEDFQSLASFTVGLKIARCTHHGGSRRTFGRTAESPLSHARTGRRTFVRPWRIAGMTDA
jgi:hypothetical protein